MNRGLRTLAAVAIGAAGVALSLGAIAAGNEKEETPAPAGKTIFVNGTWEDCNTIAESKQDGDNQLITVGITEKFKGTLDGSYEGTERNVVAKDGTAAFHGSGMFAGKISGRSGTAVMTYSGKVDDKGDARAHWVLDQGSDGLARIDGQGTFEGRQLKSAPQGCTDPTTQSAFAGTYKGNLQFTK